MTTADRIFQEAQQLPESAQAAVLQIVKELAARRPTLFPLEPDLTLRETADLRGKLAAWEEEWNAPGMEIYDRD